MVFQSHFSKVNSSWKMVEAMPTPIYLPSPSQKGEMPLEKVNKALERACFG